MKPFKFLTKQFNPRDYDIDGYVFIGVTTVHRSIIDTTPYRIMVYMEMRTNVPVLANRIREHEEPYHQADIIEVRGELAFRLPRQGEVDDHLNVTITYTPNETI